MAAAVGAVLLASLCCIGPLLLTIARTGGCTIPERISAGIRAGRCACEVKSPSGACCLGEVRAAVGLRRPG